MIRIGIEVNRTNLHCDLLEHPGRYFFILLADSRASLCIRTCDSQGENIQVHIIDGLSLNEDGNLYSVFEESINDAILELHDLKIHSSEGALYPLSSHLARIISSMPDLVDWIVSSILSNGKNLVIYYADP
ncbi:MAG: hypothetical protein WA137_06605 [Methanothrix sp.]|jgi:hypothetical protein